MGLGSSSESAEDAGYQVDPCLLLILPTPLLQKTCWYPGIGENLPVLCRWGGGEAPGLSPPSLVTWFCVSIVVVVGLLGFPRRITCSTDGAKLEVTENSVSLRRFSAKAWPVPEPIAARAVRRGIFYQADILLKRIVGAVPWPEASNAVDKDLWFDIGTTIRRFHDAGLNHVDLNCDNVLVGNGRVYLIDFDKCDIRRTEPGGLVKWKLKNLARLHRSLAKRMGDVDIESLWGSLMDGYHGASHKGKSSCRDGVCFDQAGDYDRITLKD